MWSLGFNDNIILLNSLIGDYEITHLRCLFIQNVLKIRHEIQKNNFCFSKYIKKYYILNI